MGERCTVEGTVQHVIFQNEENGYTVLGLLTEEGELVTVVGCIPCVAPGEKLTADGLWVSHPSYGQQFAAETVERLMPETEEELELSDAQSARNDEIYNAAYEFCKVMAEDDDLQWNMEILGELADLAAELLTRHGSRVRYPAVVTEPDGRQYIEEYHGGIK